MKITEETKIKDLIRDGCELTSVDTYTDFYGFPKTKLCAGFVITQKPIEKPMFKTEDGLDVFKKNHPKIWWVRTKDNKVGVDMVNVLSDLDLINYKYFKDEAIAIQFSKEAKINLMVEYVNIVQSGCMSECDFSDRECVGAPICKPVVKRLKELEEKLGM